MNIVTPQRSLSGLACLAAITRFHGLDFSEASLLQLAAPGLDAKVSPAALVQVARKIGLSAKRVAMSWMQLGRLGQALPAILVLRNGEAVILSGLKETADRTEVVVRDLRTPNQGFQFWDRAELEQ